MSTTVDTLIERFAGQRVVAVCHGGVVNVALGLVLGIGLERPLWFEPGYSSLHRVKASRSGIKSIASINELAHLAGEAGPRMSDATSPVAVEHDGPITIVTIDRPHARNAVDRPTAALLADAFRAFDADDERRVAHPHRSPRHVLRGRRPEGRR